MTYVWIIEDFRDCHYWKPLIGIYSSYDKAAEIYNKVDKCHHSLIKITRVELNKLMVELPPKGNE